MKPPAMESAEQTMPPTTNAVMIPVAPLKPTEARMKELRISVIIVMPETGLVPTVAIAVAATVVNKKANKKTTITFEGLLPNRPYKMIVKAFVENKKDKTKTYYGDMYKLHVITGGHAKTETNAIAVKAEKKEITVGVGKTKKLKITLTPEVEGYKFLAHSGGPVFYTSLKPSVATVDAKGNVTGVKAGECTIEIRTHTGAYTTVKVTVKEK